MLDKLRAGGSRTRSLAGCAMDALASRLRRVSHEAIYTWIYALPKGELARLGILLRTGRTQRRPRGRRSSPGAGSWA